MLPSSSCNDRRVVTYFYNSVFRERIYEFLLLRVSCRRPPSERLARRRHVRRRFVDKILANRVLAHVRELTLSSEVCRKIERL
jgi:hypothetical protein